jgi:ketosteroid isomerase-like protein
VFRFQRSRRLSPMATSPGLETDEHEVLAANQAFYEALQALDLKKMAEVWWHEEWVKCVHPGWELIQGWEEIEESWASIFRSTEYMRVTLRRALVHVLGDTAWVSCVENVTSTSHEGFTTALVEATNIFVRRNGRWKMVHHHAAPLPGRLPAGASQTVQ